MIAGPSVILATLVATAATAPPSSTTETVDTLTLGEAIRLALEADPALASAEAAGDAATAGVRMAEASRFPSLSAWAQLTRFEEPMIVAPIHAFDLANTPDFDRLLVQGRAEMAYTVWDGGERGARIAGARAVESGQAGTAEAARQGALDRTVEAYLAVLTARDVVVAETAHREELEAERDRVSRFLAEGAAAEIELLRAEAELSAATAEESAAGARLELAESTLARLLDVPSTSLAGEPLVDVSLSGSADLALDEPLLEGHPTITAARGRAESARAAARSARAAWLPVVRATAALVEYGGGSAPYLNEWQAGLQVEYPLFTGGSRSGAADRAEAEARVAEADLERIRRDLLLMVDAARSAETEARSRTAALSAAVDRFEELARVEALALDEGVGVQRDFLRAQAGLLEARTGLAEARRAAVRARVRLARAIGRLTPGWIDQSLEPVS